MYKFIYSCVYALHYEGEVLQSTFSQGFFKCLEGLEMTQRNLTHLPNGMFQIAILLVSVRRKIRLKFILIRGVDTKICPAVFTGEGMPRFKKFRCFENRKF